MFWYYFHQFLFDTNCYLTFFMVIISVIVIFYNWCLLSFITFSLTFYLSLMFTYRLPAPTLAFVSAYIQIRIDGWRLCQAHRRPQPKTAEDMGEWVYRRKRLLTPLLFFAIYWFSFFYFPLLYFILYFHFYF